MEGLVYKFGLVELVLWVWFCRLALEGLVW